MLKTLVKNLFGSRNDRLLKDYGKKAQQINALEDATKKLSDAALKAKTTEFKKRLNEGQKLDDLLIEAFAVVRETSRRVLEMRHFDVQLIGGMALHEGKISEMRTGEGKTLVATLPIYLNALLGKGVHVITVNDYLAKRDAEWMGQIYRFLGLEVGINLSNISSEEKKKAYEADITYGTNNEFGFDYLRDNMIFSKEERVQRKLHYGLVDEVDSILIDEARTPLIISGQAEDNVDLYTKINLVVAKLSKQKTEEEGGDYWIDEKAHQVVLSESGHENVEKLLIKAGLLSEESSLYDATNISLVHHINASLKARNLFNKDQHYVVKDNSIIIVDEFSGRMMPGRRWSEGIHQAVEAKEGVEIQKENQTLASITFQNYFRMYEKLSGMTGTADTEAFEFNQIYGLETIIIPPHRTTQRKDMMDKVYRTSQERYAAVIEDIKACQKINQPVLVGTTSIENSELISALLTKVKLKHQVLNAKHHEKEAHIIAQAGRPGMITIATNMAGRGTDIVLGGSIEADIHEIKLNDKLTESKKEKEIKDIRDAWKEQNSLVVKAGGLHIIGTERHESRRVDNQLRGRAGRQGDPGSSRFYLSLEDSLLRIFASDRVSAIMEKLKMPEGEAIEHSWVTKAIENAQRKVEGRNFDIRKQLLEYDDVANDQRKVIYEQRNELLDSDQTAETVSAMRADVLRNLSQSHIPQGSMEDMWDIPSLEKVLFSDYGLSLSIQGWIEKEPQINIEDIYDRVISLANKQYQEKESLVGADVIRHFEKTVMLQSIDHHWREHLSSLDHLRQGIHLRSYAQKNPKQEYKKEAFELFGYLLDTVKSEVTRITMVVKIKNEDEVNEIDKKNKDEVKKSSSKKADTEDVLPKVGRNDPCPCGSDKKYKHCHGALE
ncbi:preprotein translocase subunit SecA [Candidatus Methylopumilus universalis]|jgi:preprotein translocase subunit SecA|uniref:preprotein translocase subunit SecA n=1 Tax=Candidatus Methylopumilus TaxID=1679002 RepID=UPI00111FB787|nr:preprotein translocase subunit SecA [Candidatus Methylopumilus universalis]MBP7855985.1 preprotein translocase subunit SecA [Candidatus Methylopumilus sp.]MCF8182815.1 preprotein translocase subunit SecA [Limnohabitans sp.]QDC46445.1 preprotein translocase subunit SecA [Candidatus Methylopumilus universalis]QDC70964.1 preprotein translocase subunit SecA [Candidatus Methylopumilus universalis]QDC96736.1 preprotein translocase subunit SecA [Candidatus Methylopumilus universalis]